MIQFLIWAAINAAILSVMPWVKHRGYGSCFLVAAIMALAGRILFFLAIPMLVVGAVVSVIPILGWVAGPLMLLALVWLINTVALYVADKAIDGFEIPTLGQTALVALLLSFCTVVIHVLVN